MTTSTETPVSIPTPIKMLSINEFYELLNRSIGKNKIRQFVKDGRIRSIPVGEVKRLIPATELTDWVHRELDQAA